MPSCRSSFLGNNPSIYTPLNTTPGYTNFNTTQYNSNTLFTAHPLKLVNASDYDNKKKYIKLSKSCNDIFTTTRKPNMLHSKIVKCPQQVKSSYKNVLCYKS